MHYALALICHVCIARRALQTNVGAYVYVNNCIRAQTYSGSIYTYVRTTLYFKPLTSIRVQFPRGRTVHAKQNMYIVCMCVHCTAPQHSKVSPNIQMKTRSVKSIH